MDMNHLLSLSSASVEMRAGLPPHCHAAVRLLDDVSLSVAPGDCVLVRHHDPAGARVFLSVLAGMPIHAALPSFSGERQERTGLRIRRTSVRAGVLPWVISGWGRRVGASEIGLVKSDDSEAPRAVAERASPAPVVHLLRVSRIGSVNPLDGWQWKQWASREYAQDNAVVLLVQRGPVVARGRGRERPAMKVRTEHGPCHRELSLVDGRLSASSE